MFDLKRFRKHFKLTQTDIAFLFECGQPNIAAIEGGKRGLTPAQLHILEEKYGNLDKYKSMSEQPDSEISENDWEALIEKHQATIERLLGLLEKEKEEKSKLIETINMLTSTMVDKKAI